jgi:hypothetical protein
MAPLIQGLLIGFFGTGLYMAVDTYEPDRTLAFVLKRLAVIFTWGSRSRLFINQPSMNSRGPELAPTVLLARASVQSLISPTAAASLVIAQLPTRRTWPGLMSCPSMDVAGTSPTTSSSAPLKPRASEARPPPPLFREAPRGKPLEQAGPLFLRGVIDDDFSMQTA